MELQAAASAPLSVLVLQPAKAMAAQRTVTARRMELSPAEKGDGR
jgi:hypothetical protein